MAYSVLLLLCGQTDSLTSTHTRASLVAQTVKNLPAMLETWVRLLVWEGPLQKSMATHSSILAWRIPRTEEPGGYGSWGRKEIFGAYVLVQFIEAC